MTVPPSTNQGGWPSNPPGLMALLLLSITNQLSLPLYNDKYRTNIAQKTYITDKIQPLVIPITVEFSDSICTVQYMADHTHSSSNA